MFLFSLGVCDNVNFKKKSSNQALVVQACNPIRSGARHEKD
jgi:hypothetical protein